MVTRAWRFTRLSQLSGLLCALLGGLLACGPAPQEAHVVLSGKFSGVESLLFRLVPADSLKPDFVEDKVTPLRRVHLDDHSATSWQQDVPAGEHFSGPGVVQVFALGADRCLALSGTAEFPPDVQQQQIFVELKPTPASDVACLLELDRTAAVADIGLDPTRPVAIGVREIAPEGTPRDPGRKLLFAPLRKPFLLTALPATLGLGRQLWCRATPFSENSDNASASAGMAVRPPSHMPENPKQGCEVELYEASGLLLDFRATAAPLLTVEVAPKGTSSKVSSKQPGIAGCIDECSAYYEPGTEVELIVQADTKAYFRQWSEPSCGNQAHCKVRLGNEPRRITANFAPRICASYNPGDKACGNTGPAWCWGNPLPQGNTLKAIHGVRQENTELVFAVGELGTILKYDGQVWTSEPSPSPKTLNGVYASPGHVGEAWAVGGPEDGGAGIVLFRSAKTQSWSPVAIGGSAGTPKLNGVFGTGERVMAVGDGALCELSVARVGDLETPQATCDGFNSPAAKDVRLQTGLLLSASDYWLQNETGEVFHNGTTPIAIPEEMAGLVQQSNQVVALSQKGAVYSHNGINWERILSPPSLPMGAVFGRPWMLANSLYVVVDVDEALILYQATLATTPKEWTVVSTLEGLKDTSIVHASGLRGWETWLVGTAGWMWHQNNASSWPTWSAGTRHDLRDLQGTQLSKLYAIANVDGLLAFSSESGLWQSIKSCAGSPTALGQRKNGELWTLDGQGKDQTLCRWNGEGWDVYAPPSKWTTPPAARPMVVHETTNQVQILLGGGEWLHSMSLESGPMKSPSWQVQKLLCVSAGSCPISSLATFPNTNKAESEKWLVIAGRTDGTFRSLPLPNFDSDIKCTMFGDTTEITGIVQDGTNLLMSARKIDTVPNQGFLATTNNCTPAKSLIASGTPSPLLGVTRSKAAYYSVGLNGLIIQGVWPSPQNAPEAEICRNYPTTSDLSKVISLPEEKLTFAVGTQGAILVHFD